MTEHAEIAARLAAAIAQPRMLVDHATVPTELLADALAEITCLEAEVEHPSWLYSSNPTTWPEWAQTWQADYLTATTALAAAEAEIATLREALRKIGAHCPGAQTEAEVYAIVIAALATPTATAREGDEG